MDDSEARRIIGRWQTGGTDLRARAALLDDLNALFASHEDRVYRACFRFFPEPERARELAQDVLLIAWSKLDLFDGRARFSTWLYAISRNVARRARDRRRDLLTEDGVLDAAEPASSALKGLLLHEREQLVSDAMGVLAPDEQEAVYLRYVEQLSVAAITDVLSLTSQSGARGLLQRCKRKLGPALRRRLAEMGHGSSFVRSVP